MEEVRRDGEEDDDDPAELFGEDARVFFDFRPAGRSVADSIVEASGEFDRMVLGTGIDRNLLGRQVLSRTSRQIVERSRCPVVLVRPREGALKFGVQTFFQFFQELEAEGEEPEAEEDRAPGAEDEGRADAGEDGTSGDGSGDDP